MLFVICSSAQVDVTSVYFISSCYTAWMDTTYSSSLPLSLSIIKTFVAEGRRNVFPSAAAGMIMAVTVNCLSTFHGAWFGKDHCRGWMQGQQEVGMLGLLDNGAVLGIGLRTNASHVHEGWHLPYSRWHTSPSVHHLSSELRGMVCDVRGWRVQFLCVASVIHICMQAIIIFFILREIWAIKPRNGKPVTSKKVKHDSNTYFLFVCLSFIK